MGPAQGRETRLTARRLIAVAAVTLVAAAAVAGFWAAGSPNRERARKMDERRVDSLRNIGYAVENFYRAKGRLPEKLAGLPELLAETATDPKTHQPYEYRATGDDSYELCAVFEAESRVGDYNYGAPMPMSVPSRGIYGTIDWSHGAGRKCFSVTVSQEDVKRRE
jgi:hypothetical protein